MSRPDPGRRGLIVAGSVHGVLFCAFLATTEYLRVTQNLADVIAHPELSGINRGGEPLDVESVESVGICWRSWGVGVCFSFLFFGPSPVGFLSLSEEVVCGGWFWLGEGLLEVEGTCWCLMDGGLFEGIDTHR